MMCDCPPNEMSAFPGKGFFFSPQKKIKTRKIEGNLGLQIRPLWDKESPESWPTREKNPNSKRAEREKDIS